MRYKNENPKTKKPGVSAGFMNEFSYYYLRTHKPAEGTTRTTDTASCVNCCSGHQLYESVGT